MKTIDINKKQIILALEKYSHKQRIKILKEMIEMYESEMLIFGRSK